MREKRARAGEQAETDARLQHAITIYHEPPFLVVARPIERVCQCADKTRRGLARQLRVGIDGDYVTDKPQFGGICAHHAIAGVRGPAQKSVELSEFATLALVTHPAPL